MEDLLEPLIRAKLRLLGFLVRVTIEAILEGCSEGIWQLSKSRSWVGWIPVGLLAATAMLTAYLAWRANHIAAAAALLVVALLMLGARILYLLLSRSRRPRQ